MSYIPTLLVNLVSSHANYGKLEGTFENDNLTSGTENVYYQVTSPSGAVIKSIDYNTPDGVLTVGTPSMSLPLVSIPTVTNGDWEEGEYAILFRVENGASLGIYVNYPLAFTLDVLNQGVDTCVKKGFVEFITDCLCLKMTVTDKTSYSDVTLVSRELTIVPPTIPNLPPPVNIVTPDALVTFSFEYSGVTYTANLFSIYEHYATTTPGGYPDVVIRESISYTQAEKVSCDHNLCKLITCVNEFYTTAIKKASDYGGVQKLPSDWLEKWLLIQIYLTLYSNAIQCKDTDMMDSIFKKLQQITGCKCGCGDGNSSNEIVKLVPLCSAGTGVDTVNGNAPVVVSVVGTTATISLDSAFVALVTQGLQELIVNTGDGSTDYLTISAGATDTQKIISFDTTSLKYGAWVVSNNSKINVALFGFDVDATPYPLRWAKNSLHQQVKIDGTFSMTAPIVGVPLCIYDSAAVPDQLIPAAIGTRASMPIPCFDVNGNCVGSIVLNGVTATKNVLFTANSNYVFGSVVYTNGVFNLD